MSYEFGRKVIIKEIRELRKQLTDAQYEKFIWIAHGRIQFENVKRFEDLKKSTLIDFKNLCIRTILKNEREKDANHS